MFNTRLPVTTHLPMRPASLSDALSVGWIARLLLLTGLLFALAAPPAQAFNLKDSKGKTHRLEDYKGQWVLVNFWATWCPPCLEEIPDLVALHENKKYKLVVIGIAMDYKNPKQVLDFAEQQMVSYPIVLGNPEIAAQIGQLRGLPTTYLYNPQGKVVAYNVGALTREAVEEYIKGRPAQAKR